MKSESLLLNRIRPGKVKLSLSSQLGQRVSHASDMKVNKNQFNVQYTQHTHIYKYIYIIYMYVCINIYTAIYISLAIRFWPTIQL